MTTPAAIEALMKDVTPGPWVVYGEPEVGLPPGLFSGSVGQTGFGPLEPLSGYDLGFIAAARDLIPALAAERDAALTEAAALRKEVDRLRGLISGIREKSSSYLTSAMCDAALAALKGTENE